MSRISKLEIRKDTVQGAVEAMADTVGEVTTILTSAVKDVAASVGGLATELFELRDSARKAEQDGVLDAEPDSAFGTEPDAVAVTLDDPEL